MSTDEIRESLEYPPVDSAAHHVYWKADARDLPLPNNSVDLVLTSPPYWKKRDYGYEDQIGQEPTPEAYVDSLMTCVDEWKRVLRSKGSILLNIGDTYKDKSRVGIPWLVAQRMREDGWRVRSEIIWHKPNGMPTSASDRLNSRHEQIFHFTQNGYYFDKFGFKVVYDDPVDVWKMSHGNNEEHLAPFPSELVERGLIAACPPAVCRHCRTPRERLIKKSLTQLNPDRPQARRAMKIFEESDLTEDHIKAIQATGISDVGKGRQVQNGTGVNSPEVVELAFEAKKELGGYFREFTFPIKTTQGWTECDCQDKKTIPGMVLDPFAGSGTTVQVAKELGVSGVGVDLNPPKKLASTSGIEVVR